MRAEREETCVEDPARPGKRIQADPRCPHGTTGGHDNWRCQCRIVPGTEHRPTVDGAAVELVRPDQLWWPVPGCEPVKLARLRYRRAPRPVVSDTETIGAVTTS